ncbi:hypothetical protein [Streptomyces sp. NPDC058451]|uniref:hypothetical protein n=1 Tax=Streptomyces sp. NPDC058451 TaxID=3346506 RepID=UPI00366344FD
MRPLLDVLRALNVEDAWVLHNDLGDRFMLEPVPDFVVGVLAGDDSDRWDKPKGFTDGEVTLRLGLAAGRGVPALIIAPPSIEMRTPDPLITVVACEVDSRQALADHIWAFTTTLDLSPANLFHEPTGRRLRNADEYLTALERIEWGGSNPGVQFERLMVRMLMEAGAAVVNSEPYGFMGEPVDIAFMPSGGSSDIVLVELKAGHLTEKRLSEAEKQLQALVIERHAKYGMVLYHDVEGRPLRSRHSTPLILRVPARELIHRLADDPLSKVLDTAVIEAVGRL